MIRLLARVVLALGMLLYLGSGSYAQQPPAETGTIAGAVLEKTSGDPVIEAGVEVVGQNIKTQTDLDGKYTLKVPAGKYELRIFAPLHQSLRLQNVTVKPNQVTRANASLAVTQAGVDVVEVVAQADKATEATQLQQRRKAAVVSETVSAETIKKTPDADAAEVVQRVPAVTIKDNKFIFVRGLGERYSSALLNGSRLPSTDPERRVVPLDLFPSDFIESLSVIKSYTPDLPGDFSGGLVDIHVREFPEKLSAAVGLSAGGNTNVTLQDNFQSYRGGNLDYAGLSTDFRRLPTRVANEAASIENARSFKNIWQVRPETTYPNTGFNVSVGDSFGPLGLDFAGIYTTEYTFDREIDREFGISTSTGLFKRDDSKINNSVFKTRLGGLFTAAYKLAADHKVTFRTLVDHNTSDLVSDSTDRPEANGRAPQRQTEIRYTAERLAYGQITGEDRWPWLWLDWRSAYSRTTLDVPDNRFTTYRSDIAGQPLQFSIDSLGGSRIFRRLDETLSDSAVDLTIPFRTPGLPLTTAWSDLPAKFKFGPAYSIRNRDFQQRRFRFVASGAAIDLTQPPEDILDPANLGVGAVSFVEQGQPRDQYSVSQEIAGAYGMFDLPILETLRLVAGVREEASYIVLRTSTDQGLPTKVIKNNLDPLPGANLIFSPREDMNFRLSYARSVSRPDFRELSPTLYPAQRGSRVFQGNPNLVESHIESYDIRWEWFFSPLELISLSGFQKQIEQPIEATVKQGASDLRDSFANSKEGELSGFEFEGRKDFGFLAHALANLSLLANVTYIRSNVVRPIPGPGEAPQTDKERALQGAAPYIVNAALDYTHPVYGTIRLLYNRAGDRISGVGTKLANNPGGSGLPNIIEASRDELDAVLIFPLQPLGIPLTGKFALENLLDDPVLFTQGNAVQRRFTTGIKVSLGFSYHY